MQFVRKVLRRRPIQEAKAGVGSKRLPYKFNPKQFLLNDLPLIAGYSLLLYVGFRLYKRFSKEDDEENDQEDITARFTNLFKPTFDVVDPQKIKTQLKDVVVR